VVTGSRQSIGEADRLTPELRLGLVIPRGTEVAVRIKGTLDSRTNRAGDGFRAVLTESLFLNGERLLPAGTPFTGHVTRSNHPETSKGRAMLELTLDSFRLRGQEYRVDTSNVSRDGSSQRRRNILIEGGSAAIDALTGRKNGGDADRDSGGSGSAVDAFAYVVIGPEIRLTFKLKHAVEM
jgi:hypothetical protein